MTMNSDEARRTIESLNAVGSPVERHVRPRACAACGSDCNERDELTKAEREIERLRSALMKANAQAEYFERQWYLRGDALEVAVRQNEHDMLMTGEELRACRAALGA